MNRYKFSTNNKQEHLTYRRENIMSNKPPEMTLLTEKEIELITGAKNPSKQIFILTKYRINHIVDIHGRPRLTWHQLNHPLKSQSYKELPDYSSLQ
ncbi:DUF4224 domain-containing protein [Shewanella alkalitolerans]|uniref:DUF4224 domain-containing protein n=1 Tax=Shewanella alkalitolerans TaxID=2864209 RepID=UPI0033139F5C